MKPCAEWGCINLPCGWSRNNSAASPVNRRRPAVVLTVHDWRVWNMVQAHFTWTSLLHVQTRVQIGMAEKCWSFIYTCFQLEVNKTLPASFIYLKLSKLSFLTFRFQQSMLSENFEWPTISTEKTPPPKLFCPCEKSFSKLFEVVATSSTSFAFLPPPFISWRRKTLNSHKSCISSSRKPLPPLGAVG